MLFLEVDKDDRLKIEEVNLATIGILKYHPLIPAYTIRRPTEYRTEDIPLLSIRVLQHFLTYLGPSQVLSPRLAH